MITPIVNKPIIAIGLTKEPDTGEVTMFFLNEKWGPVVTGKNLEEAKEKMVKATKISFIAKELMSAIKNQNELSESINNTKELIDTTTRRIMAF